MVSGIIPIFKHLLKLCAFFLNTINITSKGIVVIFFSLFLGRKREKNKLMFYMQRDTTYNTISSKPSSTLGFSKCFLYMLYAIFGT